MFWCPHRIMHRAALRVESALPRWCGAAVHTYTHRRRLPCPRATTKTDTAEGLKIAQWTGSAREVQVQRPPQPCCLPPKMPRTSTLPAAEPPSPPLLPAELRCALVLSAHTDAAVLCPMQALEALRRRLAAVPYDMPDEAMLRWYLLDRSMDVDEAHDKLLATLRWRREFGYAPRGTICEPVAVAAYDTMA
jgi:hypothetical protein